MSIEGVLLPSRPLDREADLVADRECIRHLAPVERIRRLAVHHELADDTAAVDDRDEGERPYLLTAEGFAGTASVIRRR